VIAAIIDPQQGVGREVHTRLWIAASRINPRFLGTELFHLLVNAVDIGYYAEIALGRDGRLWPATLAVSGAAFLYAASSVVRALRGLAHDRIAAASGALQLFYLVFVWLMYNQVIAGNYTPIALGFAAALGSTIAAAAEWAARHGRSPGRWLAGTTAIVVAILVTNTYRRLDIRDAPISVNVNAERALGAHLGKEAGRPIVVTSYNLVGLPEALSGRSAVRLDLALGQCGGQPEEDTCLRRVLVATIDALPGARFLVPLRIAIVDQPWERRIVPLLEGAAAGAGGKLREEARFTTRSGVPVLALMAVDREAMRSKSRRPSPDEDGGGEVDSTKMPVARSTRDVR
jgi:hypothetical protein